MLCIPHILPIYSPSKDSSSQDFLGGPVAKLHAPNAMGLGLIPGQGTGSHMPQLKNLHDSTKTQCSLNKQKDSSSQ